MLFQVACNQFLVIKKTWPNMFILLGGAVLNVFLNFYLIPIIGIEGAAIATLFGYISSDIVAMIVLKRMKLMDISLRFIISALGMLVVFLIWRFISSTSIVFGLLIFVCYSAMITILYKNEVLTIKNKLKKRSKQ